MIEKNKMKLYVKDGCPYCAMVLSKVDELGIKIEEKNVSEEGVIEELISIGGQKMVPFLVDDTCEIHMYESADIIDYLVKKYESEEAKDSPEEGVCPT